MYRYMFFFSLEINTLHPVRGVPMSVSAHILGEDIVFLKDGSGVDCDIMVKSVTLLRNFLM